MCSIGSDCALFSEIVAMGGAQGKYKLRLLQGGFTLRKQRLWFASLFRYRYRICAVLVVVVFPYRPLITAYIFDFFFQTGDTLVNFFRPKISAPWKSDLFVQFTQTTRAAEQKAWTPPHRTAEVYMEDGEERAKWAELLTTAQDFKVMYETSVTRNAGFIHHPSRETECLLEGALFQEDQNKLSDALRYRIADYCVKRGLWKSVGEAFALRETIRKKHNPRPPNLL